MSGLGHVAVGLAAGRFFARSEGPTLAPMLGFSALSLLPDADVLAFRFGVPYGAGWGHRGATHSLVLAGALGLLVGAAVRLFRGRALEAGLMAAAVVASHGVLDAMTDGGLGAALLWPFSHERIFFSWRPLPVGPIGLAAALGPFGRDVLKAEAAIFAPLLLYALLPRLRPAS